jgi:hypothetical protein
VTLREVKDGTASVEDLQALNAILDMQSDMEAVQIDKTKVTK